MKSISLYTVTTGLGTALHKRLGNITTEHNMKSTVSSSRRLLGCQFLAIISRTISTGKYEKRVNAMLTASFDKVAPRPITPNSETVTITRRIQLWDTKHIGLVTTLLPPLVERFRNAVAQRWNCDPYPAATTQHLPKLNCTSTNLSLQLVTRKPEAEIYVEG